MPITRMRVERHRRGITQTKLAETIGVTQPRISLWENRHQDLPPLRRGQIAKALETDPNTLLEDA